MGTLTGCAVKLRKAGTPVRADDLAAMTAKFNALTTAGNSPDEAKFTAVDEQIATVKKAIQRIESGPAPAESAAKAQAKADLMAGLGDLGALLSKGTRKNITPEEEQQLLPILTKVMDAAFRLGYLKFKDAAKFVLDQIRNALGNEAADAITLDHLSGSYIGMAGRYKDQGASTKREVVEVESLEALLAEPAQAERAKADGVTRAAAGGQEGINGEWYDGGQILPTSKDTVKGEQTRPSGPRSEPAPAVDTSVQSTPESALSGSGLVVEEKTAQSGKKYWAVSGNTREHESLLDALGFGKPFKMGGKWYRSVRDGDPTEKLAAALSGNMPTPAPAVERPSLSAEEAAPILRQFKVEVSGSGDAWIVTGKTFDIKEAIKDTGGRWNGQAWAYTQDPTGTLAAALKERGSAGNAGDDAGAGESDAEIARRRELRQREDARPDERADAGRVAEQVDQQTQALILRGEKYGIPRKVLNEQIEDIGLIVNAHAKSKPLFLLANEAGTGKTMVLGGAIRELRARGEKKFVYVTMNTDLIAQIKKDLADYGVDDVSFHTYSELSGKGFDTDGAILIFDEAHNVKNVGAETARADKAQDLMAAAKMNILASATLFENPVEARYLASTGIFDTVGGFSEWAKTYGASVKVRKFYNPNTGRQQTEEIIYWAGRGKKEDGAAARQWLFKQAIMTQRAMSIDPGLVDVQFSRNAVDQHWVDTYQTVADAYDAAEDAWKDEQGNPRDAKIVAEIARHRENTIKRVLEAAKIPHAISEAKSLIAAGRNVVIFVETKADRHLGKWRRGEHFKDDTLYSYDQMQEMMAEWDLEARMARMQNEKAPPRPFAPFIVEIARFFDAAGIDMELPSTADQITAAIGADKVAMYTGAVANTAAAKNKADFMAGRKPLLVATMAKGGTGLSLHDTVGNRPTTQLNINLPWKATGVDQVAARVARYGLRSRAEVRWLFAANIPWESTKLAPRVGARMRDMGAIVKGIEVKGAEILDGAFDFEGDIDAKGGSAIVPGAVDSDIYARAKRMEQMRRKADDTSNGFFETPYPLAALMANVGGVRVGQSLLEPSGGRGNLLRLLPEGMNITAVELRQDNRDALARLVPDAKLVPGDFMAFEGGSFDTVLMNPPFERVAEVGAQDVAHVQRAYGMLAPGGRLVAIMGEGAFFREYKQETAFRGWLDDVGATVIQMPEGAFKQSGTGVRTRMVVIDRDGEPGRTDINLHDMEIESLRAVERQVPSRYAVAAAEASLPAARVDAEPASQFEADQTPTPPAPAPAAEIDKPEAAAIVQQAETLPLAKPEAATVDAAEESEAQETAAAEKGLQTYAGPVFRRGTAYAGDTTAIQQAVDVITDQWENAPPVTVVHSMQDSRLPQAIRDEDARQRLNGSTGEPTGAFYNGRVYIVASAVRSDAEVAQVLFHEGLGHYGLRGAFGSSLDKILDQMATLNRPAVALKAKEYGFDMANQAQRRRAAEEVLAELAETRPTSSWVQKAIAAIRTWLRKNLPGVFGDMELSDAEIVEQFIVPARGFVERGQAMSMPNATPVFSGDDAQIVAPMFSRRTYDPTTNEALKRAGIGGPPSAREKIRAHWARAMQLVTDRNELAQQMRQGTLDQFAGIQRALRRDVGNLPAEQDPYIAARLANGGTSSVMRALLLHGQAQWAANGQHLEKKPGTRGLLDILKPLGDDVNDWFGWMVGNRAARLMSEGRENNFTADQIKALQALATPEKKAAFQKAAMEYTAFKRSVLDLAQAAGLINPESRKAWDHADYIPFYRQVDERSIFSATGRKGLSGQTSGIRTLKGGEAALNDPLENLLMNFSRLVDASLKNNAINRTIRALEEVDSTAVHKVGYDMTPALVPTEQVRKLLIEAGTHEAVMDAIPEEVFEGISKMWSIQQPTDPAVVRVMRGGKPVFYRVDDPLLLQSLTSFVPFDFPGLGMMRAAKRLLTATVTATPEFMLRNFIRDSVAAQAIARDGFNPAKSLQGIAKSFNESGGFESMLFAGASFQSGNVNAANPEATGVAIRRSLRSKGIAAAMAQNGFTQTLLDTGAKFWEKYREVGEAIENANREAVYEAATKEGKSPTAAAYEAKDLMDFSLRGSWAGYQLLADVLPFFNARVQGLYRVGRADPKRLATVGLMLTAASLMLAMANDGEDWYEELPDWDKDTYWHFRIGKQHFRIPKPFELGVIFATIPERIGRSIKGLDSGKKTGSRLWANVRDQLAFDPVPQLARPVLNVWANKDSFRDAPIESMSDEGKLPHLRYSARTSDTMRALTGAAPGLSDASGLSPKKLEYLLGGYLGTAGLYALALSDMLVRQLEGKPPGPSLRADDLPVVKAFYRVDPARATVFESDLYKMRAEVDAIAKSIKASAKDNPEEAARLQTTEKDKLAVRNMVVNAAKSITTLNRQRGQIYADKTMPPDEKRKQVDELQRKKNALAKQVAEHPMVKAAF